MDFLNEIGQQVWSYIQYTGFANISLGNVIMILVGFFFLYLAITKDYAAGVLLAVVGKL